VKPPTAQLAADDREIFVRVVGHVPLDGRPVGLAEDLAQLLAR
jgi:hypothetical protein